MTSIVRKVSSSVTQCVSTPPSISTGLLAVSRRATGVGRSVLGLGYVGAAAALATGTVTLPVAAATAVVVPIASKVAKEALHLSTRYLYGRILEKDEGDIEAMIPAVVAEAPGSLSKLPYSIRNSEEEMTPIIERHPQALAFATASLRGKPTGNPATFNTTLVQLAAAKDPTTLEFADPALRSNKEFMLKMCSQYPKALDHLHPTLCTESFIEELIQLKLKQQTGKKGEDLTRANQSLKETVERLLALFKTHKVEGFTSFYKKEKPEKADRLDSFNKLLDSHKIMILLATHFPAAVYEATPSDSTLRSNPDFIKLIISNDITVFHSKEGKKLIDQAIIDARNNKAPSSAIEALAFIAKAHPTKAYLSVITAYKGTPKSQRDLLQNPVFMLPIAADDPKRLTKKSDGDPDNALLQDAEFLANLIESTRDKKKIDYVVKTTLDTIKQYRETLLALATSYPEKARELFKNPKPPIDSFLLADSAFLRDMVLADISLLEILANEDHLESAYMSLVGDIDKIKEIAQIHPEQAFDSAPGWLREDEDFLESVVTQKPELLKRIPEEDLTIRLMIKCIQRNPQVFKFIPHPEKMSDRLPGLSAYEKLVLELLEKSDENKVYTDDHISFLKYISEDLKKDQRFITEAVKVRADAFKYAAPELKKDAKYILSLIATFPKAILRFKAREELFRHIDPSLKQDPSFLKKLKDSPGACDAMLTDPLCQKIVCAPKFFSDKELESLAERSPQLIGHLGLDIIRDRELIIKLAVKCPDILPYLGCFDKPRGYEVALGIISQNIQALSVIKKSTKPSMKKIWDRFESDPNAFYSIAAADKKDREQLHRRLVTRQQQLILFVSAPLATKHPEVVAKILEKSGRGLEILEMLDPSVKKIPAVFAEIAKLKDDKGNPKFGNRAYDYAHDDIRESAGIFSGYRAKTVPPVAPASQPPAAVVQQQTTTNAGAGVQQQTVPPVAPASKQPPAPVAPAKKSWWQ